jgi:hypothetical protein
LHSYVNLSVTIYGSFLQLIRDFHSDQNSVRGYDGKQWSREQTPDTRGKQDFEDTLGRKQTNMLYLCHKQYHP